MIYIGMDVSSKSFFVHGIDEKKLVIFEAGNQLKWISRTLKEMEGGSCCSSQ